MNTDWDTSSICSGFEAYGDLPEELLGYSWLLRTLKEYQGKNQKILDYGCGPGKVATRVAELGNRRILAVDTSLTMLEIARRHRPHNAIEYRLIHDGLSFLDADSISAAFACFVFINIESDKQIAEIMREIHRVLRKGAPFLIVDTNPRTTGIEFSSFRNGDSRRYRYGEKKMEVLHLPNGNDLILYDHYWPAEMYRRLLVQAGFSTVEQLEPTLQDVPSSELEAFAMQHGPIGWKEEWNHAPFLLFRAQK
jgi:ubiquinone/menaquinone biosynthesis C-methylase UbiE